MVFFAWHRLMANPNLTLSWALLLSMNLSQIIRNQWKDLSVDLIKLSQVGSPGDDPLRLSS